MSYARGITHGLALGAGLMFLLDPRQGGARRAFIRDKSIRSMHEVEHAAEIGTRDLTHRIEGAIARLFSSPHEEVSDEVLTERVRARLGHVCAHAGDVRVIPKGGGCVELKGPALRSELDEILAAVSTTRGVKEVDNDLDVHDAPGSVAALQGEHTKSVALARVFNPSLRLGAGLGAASLAISALLAGHPIGFLVGGASVLAIARSIVSRNGAIVRGRRGHRAGANGIRSRAAQEVS